MWTQDYLRSYPVHDVSCLFEGSGVVLSHRFLEEVWKTSVHGSVITFLFFLFFLLPHKRSFLCVEAKLEMKHRLSLWNCLLLKKF